MMQIELPKDVNEYVLHIQMQQKVERNNDHFSKEKTIIFLLRESMEINGFTPRKSRNEKRE